MKAPTANRETEAGDLLGSFFVNDDKPPLVIDRSELEHFAECPQRGYLIRKKQVATGNWLTDIGEEVHRAFSQATAEWIASGGVLSPSELAAAAENAMLASRPDVQPSVVQAMRYSVWEWSRFIHGIHPHNVLRFDGGEESNRSGQLAGDIRFGETIVRVTSELDLLYAGPAKQLLHEIDYKSGHKYWTERNVADAFQFQLHAWLVLNTYPEAEALEVSVWNTRANRRTYSVEFRRKDLGQIAARINSAAGIYFQFHDDSAAPTWPNSEKCAMCDAAAVCPVVAQCQKTLEEAPEKWVEAMFAVEAKFKAMADAAKSYVSKSGKDIVCPSGAAFGYSKPKASRKPSAALYKINASESEDE